MNRLTTEHQEQHLMMSNHANSAVNIPHTVKRIICLKNELNKLTNWQRLLDSPYSLKIGK